MKGFVISLLWMLSVKGDVQISVIYGQDPSHQCLHNNDDVTLTCTVNPLNDRVKWLNETTSIGRCSKYGTCFHDGGIDTMKYTFSFSSPGEFRLRINPISPATDAGVYKCEHEGVSASVTLDACVQVTSAQLQKNGVTINTGPLEVDVNELTLLTCKVLPSNSKPVPTIVWFIGSNAMKSSTSTSYTFTPSETDHDKIIYCKAYNLQQANEAVESAKAKLYVKVPVSTVQLKKDNIDFNGQTLTATVGDTVHLSCTPGFSRPSPPTIDWYIGSVQKLSNSADYAYTAEENDHNKTIFCKAYTPQQSTKAESYKPRLYVDVPVTSVTLAYQGNTPSTGDTVPVTAGRAVTFTCIPSTSRPQATIDWYIQDIYGTIKVRSGSSTYVLTATDADHNKKIYCKAYNKVTEAQGILSEKPILYVQVKVTTVTLNYQGNIPSTGDTVTVTAGRAAKFTCTTSFSRPQATIDWYIKVDHNIHAALKQSSTSPTYHLMATDADHNKRIYCKTYNNVAVAQGIVSEKPMLYVQVQVSAVTLKHNNQPLITGERLDVTAGIKETLTCEPGHSRPDPTIDWYIRDDTNRKQSSTNTTFGLDASNGDHDKVIYCKAYNLQEESTVIQSTKPKLYVRVLASVPSFLNLPIDGFTLLDGDTYSIQCQSTPTRPAALIAWKIRNNVLTNTNTREVTEDGGLVSVISTLSLDAQKSYYNSEIICESKITEQHTTPETKASLIIWWRPHKPSVRTFNGDFPWVEGGQGELTCSSTDNGNPPATIKWTPNIGTMNAENKLVIDSLSYMDHRRLVKCRVVNKFTEEKNEIVESDEISLNVQFSPKFLTTEGVFVGKIQKNVSITFPIYSNPKAVIPKLFVNGSEINNNEEYVVNKEGVSEELNLTITIVDLEEGDFAKYLLNVRNDIGTTEFNFTVTAESIPSAPTSFGLRELRGSVAIFYWERGFNGGHKQHFMLQLKGDTEDTWSNRTIVKEPDMNSNLGNTSYIANISGLNPGTYRARLIAVNSIGAADPVLLETTFTIPTQETTSSNQGGAIAGGVTAGVLVIIVILASVFILRHLRRTGLIMKKKNRSLQQQEHDYYNMSSKEKGKAFHTKESSPTAQCSDTAKYEDLTQIRGNSSAYDNIGASRNEESTYVGLQPDMSKAQVYDTLNQDNKTNTDSEEKAAIYTNLTLN